MGHTDDITRKSCGCIEHHEYDEYCAMGPVAETSKYWTEYCTIHGGYIPTKISTKKKDTTNIDTKKKETKNDEEIKGNIDKLMDEIKSLEKDEREINKNIK